MGLLEGKTSPYGYYQYLRILFHRLNKGLSFEERQKLRHTLYLVLINFDNKYRNFIGELSVLSKIKEGSPDYRLVGVEKTKIVDNNSADFTFENIHTGELEVVEVLNIHEYETKENDDILRSVLSKIEKKIFDKTKGRNDYTKFILIPVFWGLVDDIKKLNQIFKNQDVPLPKNVWEPFCYCSFDGPEFPVHKFIRISKLFEGDIEVVPGFN